MKDAVKIKFRTIVKKAFYDDETKKLTLNLEITSDLAENIEDALVHNGLEWSGDKYPIKETDGGLILKTSSMFAPAVKNMPSGFTYKDIGAGTELTAYLNLKEGEYRRKKYVSAYLSGVDVHSFEPAESYNPFEDDAFSTLDVAEAPVEESR